MKLLVVSNLYPDINSPSYGVFVKNFVDKMEEQGFDIELSVMYKRENKFKNYIKFYFSTIKKILFSSYDCTYIHFISHSALPSIITRKRGVIISNIHGTDILPNSKKSKFIAKLINRKILNKSDLIVVPSYFYKKKVNDIYNIENKKIFISPSGGIDLNKFKCMNQLIGKSGFTVGYVGRIEENKAWSILIDSFNQLDVENIKLKIAGTGSEKNKLMEKIEFSSKKESICYLGEQSHEELSILYNELDVLIFPSRKESLGLVGLEAMACGVPVIGANIPALESYIVDGGNGYLFKKDDINDLIDKINKFCDLKEDERLEMSHNALQTAKLYSSETVSNELGIKIKECLYVQK